MSSRTAQEEKFADKRSSRMSAHQEVGSLTNAEISACLPSGVVFDSPDVGSEPGDENECKDIQTVSGMQAISKQKTDDIRVLEDDVSDSARLLDGHYSRSNGEGCFENENVYLAEDLLQSRVQVEVASPVDCENKEENPSQRLDDDENDFQNAMESRSKKLRPQTEILLQPLSLCEEPSRSRSNSREEIGDSPPSNVCFIKPTGTGQQPSPTARHGRVELGANPPWSVSFIKLTSTTQHSSPTAEHGTEDLGADSSSSVRCIKPSGTRKHSSSTAKLSREEPGVDPSLSACSLKSTCTKKHSNPTAGHGREELTADPPANVRNIKPTGTRKHSSQTPGHGREELGADPPWSVRYIKPTGTRQPSSPTSERGRENRDVFETGGEPSRYLPAGVSCAGDEKIEQLPLRDSPEPQIEISPSFSDEPRANSGTLAKAFLWRCFWMLVRRTCRQFAKARIFYLVSTCIIIIGINVWDRVQTDRDIPAAICFMFGTFIGISFFVDRGQLSHLIDRCNTSTRETCTRECRRACGNADPCIPWCCCSPSPEPRLERHSQYRHLEEDGAFQHEIADVARLGPKDCPQMKMVEQRETEHAESPDYPPEVSQVNADVHVGKRDGEKLGAARKHLGKAAAQTTKPRQTQSKSRPRPTKTFRADIHAPDSEMIELSPLQLSPIHEKALDDGTPSSEGQPADSDVAGTCTMGARTTPKNLENASSSEDLGRNEISMEMTADSSGFPGGVFKKFSECSPTLPRFANIPQEDISGYGGRRSASPEYEPFPVDMAEEYVCEHYGQGVACSCPTFLAMAEEDINR